jgi:hypothetical protein
LGYKKVTEIICEDLMRKHKKAIGFFISFIGIPGDLVWWYDLVEGNKMQMIHMVGPISLGVLVVFGCMILVLEFINRKKTSISFVGIDDNAIVLVDEYVCPVHQIKTGQHNNEKCKICGKQMDFYSTKHTTKWQAKEAKEVWRIS